MPATNFFSEGSPYLNHPGLTSERTAQEIDFVLSKIHLPPGSRILDVGCGAGRHSIELARRGYKVTGIDPSSTMIHAAQERSRGFIPAPDFSVIHGENFITETSYQAAICLFTTLGQIDSHADTPEDNHTLVKSVVKAVHQDGVFVIEVPQRAWTVSNLKTNERFEEGDSYTEVKRTYNPENKTITEIFSLVSPSSTQNYLLRYRLYDKKEMNNLLAGAGFEIFSTYGGYVDTPLQDDSPVMVMFARKL